MRDLNIEFLEEYKRVDIFIRDAYGTQSGVTEYLRQMETSSSEPVLPDSWRDDYRDLKHLRRIRNRLAHELSVDSDVCDKDDLRLIRAFYSRLLIRDDPLARLDALKKQRQRAQKRASAAREAQNREERKTNAETSRKSVAVRAQPVSTCDYSRHTAEEKKKNRGPLAVLGIIVCLLAVAVAAWIIIAFIRGF